jgi:repressor LexA
MPMIRLTPRQDEILTFVRTRILGGLPPTRAEIALHFGFRSPNAAEDHLRALQRKGFLTLGSRKREIRLVAP